MTQDPLKLDLLTKLSSFKKLLNMLITNYLLQPEHLHARVPISLIWAIVCVIVTKTLTPIEPINAF